MSLSITDVVFFCITEAGVGYNNALLKAQYICQHMEPKPMYVKGTLDLSKAWTILIQGHLEPSNRIHLSNPYMHIYTHVHTYIYIHPYTYYTSNRVLICMYIYIITYVCIYIYIYIYIERERDVKGTLDLSKAWTNLIQGHLEPSNIIHLSNPS